MLTLEAQAD